MGRGLGRGGVWGGEGVIGEVGVGEGLGLWTCTLQPMCTACPAPPSPLPCIAL